MKLEEPVRMPDDNCPVCGAEFTAVTGVTGAKIPKPGDLTICKNCTVFLKFDKNLKTVQLTGLELMLLPPENVKDLYNARAFIRSNRK